MNEMLKMQLIIFGSSCALGAALGFMYDLFRIVRMIINPKNIGIFIQDVIYFILSGVITFLFVLCFNNGESRFYILAGEGIGWIAYHVTIGNSVYKLSGKFVKSIRNKIFGISGNLKALFKLKKA
ncbi:MAG: spore cortex biosynthesis protein YabQ [Clostridia bacterium]|nr:spore cortex biosynthesis protein YabQ [Clostridia bacterium]